MRLGIVGGGIVGLAIGIAALRTGVSAVTILDKEPRPGTHASSRNSGVLHSGIYYSADSLKAKFSIEGNEALRKLCRDRNIPILESGKLILSQDQLSEHQLSELMLRANTNGVEASRLEKSELGLFEKQARTYETFIHVKKTAVSSPGMVLDALKEEFDRLGGKWRLGHKIENLDEIRKGGTAADRGEFELVVNAAGSQALALAKTVGVGGKYFTTPFLGLYWGIEQDQLPLKIPLYPTPHPINPFLGVHLTPTISGLTKIGPTAIPVLGKEQYSLLSGIRLDDSVESLRALTRIARGKKHSLVAMVSSELPKFFRSQMIKEAQKLFDGLDRVSGWHAVPGGIRAQLVDNQGELVQDFIVEKSDGIVHVLNAVSPGWTSAIPFGEWIVENFVTNEGKGSDG